MRLRWFISVLLIPVLTHAQGIVIDHTSIEDFDRIPAQYVQAAAELRMLFMDRSVGANINDYLDCLSSSFEAAPSRCKRYTHRDSAYAVNPTVVQWAGVWNRSNWRYEFWPGCSEDAICFIDFIEPRIDSFDVVGFQFSYLAVTPGSKLNDPVTGFFTPGTDKNTAEAYAAFAARHPDKTVIWWTTSLARSIGTDESQSFNKAMRDYASTNNIVLFDVADILSHDPDGNPCYDNRDGVPYLEENNPDDGLDIPAICPQYTTETEGGHLGSIAAGGIRVAKAFWVLMARIAGWRDEQDTVQVPERVQLISPPNGTVHLGDSVVFLWQTSFPDVTKYRLQVSTASSFTSLIVDDSTLIDTTARIFGFDRGLTLYWRVAARNQFGWGPWSESRTFTMKENTLFSATPLTEMGESLYQGFEGGLYPSTLNTRPPTHNQAGRAIANSIQPLDSLGNVDLVNGKIVMMSIGMSNTGQEYSFFESVLDTFALKNPKLVSVSGAQAGQTAAIIRNPDAPYWDIIETERLYHKRVTREQVQVVWIKEANASPIQPFPRHAEMLEDDLRAIVQLLPSKYPNIQLCYISSRTYGGYATTALNPEPYAYESGFSVKWLVGDQILGDTALSFSGPGRRAPWLSWGPYLWASGETPRLDNGLFWVRDDFVQDGTHPSESGRAKVAKLLLDFFSHDETTIPWFLAQVPSPVSSLPIPESLAMNLSPNPVSQMLHIHLRSQKAVHGRIFITDALGRVQEEVHEDLIPSGSTHYAVDMKHSRYPNGLYFVHVLLGNQVLSKLLIVIH